MKNKKKKDTFNINMVVRDDDDFLSVFSTREAPVISSDVADFLQKSTPVPTRNSQLKLTIYSNCIDEDEQYVYKCAIKEYFRELYEATKQKIRYRYTVAVILAIIGAVLLGITYGISNFLNFSYIEEIMDIIACFFLWEAINQGALKSQELRLEKKKYVAFLKMHIKFKNRD